MSDEDLPVMMVAGAEIAMGCVELVGKMVRLADLGVYVVGRCILMLVGMIGMLLGVDAMVVT